MAEILNERTGEKVWSDEPIVPTPLVCKLGWHRWFGMRVYTGLRKRGVRLREGCIRCGRIRLTRYGFWGGGSYKNGYVRPECVTNEVPEPKPEQS